MRMQGGEAGVFGLLGSIVGTSCVPSVNQSRGGLIDLIWNVSQMLLLIVVYYGERRGAL